jgi:peptidoglycan/xylan/chitin deacetylase (PgdA/CDA1 family)
VTRAIALLFHDVYVDSPSESGFRSDAADRYKLSLARFAAQLDGVAVARSDAPVVVADAAFGVGSGWPFLITVDDGGISYHRTIAPALEARGWRGHCFVTTDYIGRDGFLSATQIRDLDRRGHRIGSHSASHPARFSACGFDRMVREWSQSRQVLEDVLGHEVTTASVPGGYFSIEVARAAAAAGIRVLFTSEPLTRITSESGCLLIGRFTIRRGDADHAARKLVMADGWAARAGAWAAWNAKGLIKPVLGSSYVRLSNWLHAVTHRAPRVAEKPAAVRPDSWVQS